jgi:hypothetical protein
MQMPALQRDRRVPESTHGAPENHQPENTSQRILNTSQRILEEYQEASETRKYQRVPESTRSQNRYLKYQRVPPILTESQSLSLYRSLYAKEDTTMLTLL